MRQLFANNAATTLAAPLSNLSDTILLTDSSAFPDPGQYEFFSITVELGDLREIIYCDGKVGNSLTILVRGAEGTSASSFPAGAKAENRITRETISRNTRSFIPLSTVDTLLPPSTEYGDSFVFTGTLDPAGAPAMVTRKDDISWSFLNYTRIASGQIQASTTTSVTFNEASAATSVTPGKYLIQYNGYIREVDTQANNVISWTAPLSSSPVVGSNVELYKAISSMTDLTEIIDDAFVTALIMSN